MANSWNGPKLGSPIRTDVPELQKKLIALLKQDPTSVANIPSGAKRLVNTSGTRWQVQQYNGSSWAAIGKLMHDVDKLDGYHAAITPNANTIAVRNADKKLEGDITGNAATASSATTLSETLPVNKGGTGATTSAAARTNLGVPPTSHASSSTTYGLGSNANYGHVRGDGVTTNVVSGEVVAKDIALGGDSADPATGRGYLAKDKVPWYGGNTDAIEDFNSLTLPGCYQVRFSSTTQNAPDGVLYNSSGFDDGYIEIYKIGSASTISSYARLCQRLTIYGNNGFTTVRRQQPSSTGAWYSWQRLIDSTDLATASAAGIVKPGTGMTVNAAGELNVNTASTSKAGIVKLNNTVTSTSTSVAATANAVKMAYDKAVKAEANLPAGFVIAFAANAAPDGYLLCNGASVSRKTYADLFSAIGTIYGKGNGSTTFELPNMTDRFIQGSGTAGTYKAAGAPEIEGSFGYAVANAGNTGAIYQVNNAGNIGILSASTTGPFNTFFKASHSNSIYGASGTVQPPALTMRYYIKY